MFLEHIPGSSFAHRADVRAKLLAFTVATALSFLFTSPVPNAVLAIGSLTLLFHLGMGAREVGKLLLPMTPVLVLVVCFAALSPPPEVGARSGDVITYLWFGHNLPLTVEGSLHGASLGLRILIMVTLTSGLLLCTPVEDFTALLRAARAPLPIVFIVTTALRFVPTMQRRAAQILDAQRARGAAVDSNGVIRSIRTYATIMIPLFATGIRTSETLAAAMLCRGYGISRRPTQLRTLRMTWRDPVLIVLALTVLAAALWVRGRSVWTS